MDATAGNRISLHLRRRTVAIALCRGWKAHREAPVTPLLLRRRSRRRLLSGAGIAALLVAATLSPPLIAPARADTSWTGAADTDWHNAANWSNGVPANTGNDAYITGPVVPVISGAASGENWTWVGYGSGNSGAITIGDGGSLTAGCCFYLGANHGTGSMTVTGTGTFTASNILMLGDYNSTGYLTIENGGTVNSGFSTYVGRASGSSGYATVTGENSLWSVSASSLRIAGESPSDSAYGSVTLSDAGVLRVNGGSGSVIIGNSTNSTAFLNIGAAEGDAAVAAGTMDAGGVVLGSGDGTLVFNHTDTGLDFSTSITGSGEVRQLAGTTILSGSNTWSGSTVVEGGVLRAGGANGLSANATYEVNGGTLDLNDFDLAISELSGTGGTVDLGSATLSVSSGNTDTAFAGVIAGTGSLKKTGTGIFTLTGANTYTGGTTVSGGTLRAGGASALVGGSAYTVDGGTLDLNDFDLSMSALSGTGGTVDLGSAALAVGGGNTDTTFAGVILGTGNLVKLGSGTLTLTGDNDYTGLTVIREGTLALDGGSVDSSGNVVIGDLADAVGEVTVTGAGASLDTDSAVLVGELGEGTLNVENGGVVTADVVIAGHLSGSDGTINVAGTGSQLDSTSLLRIGDEGVGRLIVSGAGTVTNTSAGYIGAGTNGEGTATVTGTGSKFDNSGMLYVGGEYSGASGILTIADEGTVNVGAGSGTVRIADHSGAGGTLNIGAASGDAAVAAGTLNAAGVEFGSGTGQVVFNHLDAGHVFASDISGAGEVLQLSGTTILTGTNTYMGGATVSGGTLRAGGASALVGGSAYTVDGGTLDLNDFDLSMSALSGTGGTVDLGGAALAVGSGNTDTTFAGVISGTGGLEKAGTSKLSLTGSNSYSGGTMISGGTLEGTASSLAGDIVNNATLAFAQAGDGTFAGAVTGTGGVEKTGAGKLTLTGANGYTGGTTVSGGTLEGTASSLTGDIVNNAMLAFAQAADGIFGGAISGSGSMEKSGAGILTVTGTNSYTGGTAVSDGTLRAGTASALAGGSFTLTGGTLDLNDFDLSMSELSGTGGTVDLGSAALTVGSGNTFTNFAGAIEGTGSLEKTGTGELTLTGANSYTGGTTISGGVLEGSTSSLVGDIVNNATLAFTQAFDGTFGGAISGTGSLVKSGSGVLTLTGANSWSGGTTIRHGTLAGGTSSLTGDIVNDAALVFAQAGNGTFAGVISGTGSLEKTGAGTLTLTGSNSYSGGTTVSDGTLAGDTSSLQGDIVNDAALRFDQSADGTYAGVLSGTGDIVKSGAGSLVLSGISGAFTGGLEVLAGSLIVDGTFTGDLIVSGGLLGGSGTVGSTTLGTGATLAAGNSIGTLTVAGDLGLSAGSVLAVEVNDGGNAAGVNADLVHVTGAATIAGGAVVEVAAANGTDDGTTYAPSTVYRILTADGGITGVFDGVTAGFAFLMPELSYDANNVFLTLTQMAAFEDVASTPNQQGVAAAAEALGSGNPLYDEIIGMSEEEAQAAFDALSGEAHASSTGVFSGSAGVVRRTIFSRLFSRFGAPRGFAAAEGYVPAAGDETPHSYTVWGELMRGWGETDGSVSAAGIERNSTGFLGGVDREIGEASRIGIALGYSHATFDVSGRSSSGESDNFHVAGYAGTELGPVDLKGVLGYSYQMAESRRRVVVGGVADDLSADYGAHTFQASGEASLDLETGPVTLTPFAGLAVVHVETEAFTETGGPSALSIASSGNTTGISELGLRASREAGSLTLFGAASWRHVFGDVEPLSRAAFASSPATTFSVRGTPLSEDVASIGGGVEILIAEETTLEFSYRGEFASDSRDHGLKAKLRIDF